MFSLSLIYFFFSFIYISIFGNTLSTNTFSVLHSPKYIKYYANGGPIQSSEVPRVMASSYGFSLYKDLKWNGLGSGSLFHKPRANVLFTIKTQNNFPLSQGTKFSLIMDNPYINTDPLTSHLQSLIGTNGPLIVDSTSFDSVFDLKSLHPTLFKDISTTASDIEDKFKFDKSQIKHKMGSLNINRQPDLSLLAELEFLMEVSDSLDINSTYIKDNIPDLYHFQIIGLDPIMKKYGKSSSQIKDATELLQYVINKVTNKMKKVYLDDVIVQLVTLPSIEESTSNYKSRNLLQFASAENNTNLNLGEDYSSDYPIIFNIILWTSLMMALAVLIVAVGIWNMDPGRDSIIYRMTTQRIKKD